MIPLRVRLAGFLSYREPQEVTFNNGVWLLAGANGSGKSAIFDGVTYALFGMHRGGAQNAIELIHKEVANATVEFDFSTGIDAYRIKRTIKRTKSGTATGTQQLFSAAGESWNPVADTTKKVDFDAWIHAHIGLTYETFTSSVLLLQNKAEKLLDAKPAGRAEVLAGIVDLERYQALHKRADQARLMWKGQHEGLQTQLNAVPEVTPEQFANAELKVKEAIEARHHLSMKIENLLSAEGLARQWAAAQTRVAVVKEKLRNAEQVLTDAVAIEKAKERLDDLNAVLPSVQLIVVERTKITEADRKTERLTKERDEIRKAKESNEQKANEAKKKRDEIKARLVTDEAALVKLRDECQSMASLLTQVKFAEDLQLEIDRVQAEWLGLPEVSVETAKAEVDRLTELARFLPAAERYRTEQTERIEAETKAKTAKEQAERVKVEGERTRVDADRTAKELAEALAVRTKCQETIAASTARYEAAVEALARFDDVAGEQNCRACGQPLTPEHLAMERSQRSEDVKATDAVLTKARAEGQQAVERERELTELDGQYKQALEKLRSDYRDYISEESEARKDGQRLTASLAMLDRELPERLRKADDLEPLRVEAMGLETAKKTARSAETVASKKQQLQSQLEAKKQSLAKLTAVLPSENPATLRRNHAAATAKRDEWAAKVKDDKNAMETADRQADLYGRDAHEAAIRLTDLGGKLGHEEQARQYSHEAINRAVASLPAVWRSEVNTAALQKHYEWQQERDELIASGVRDRFQQLSAARGGLESIRIDLTAAESDAEQFPPEARRDPEELKREITIARKSEKDREADVAAAERANADLERDRDRRADLDARAKAADAEFHRYKLLAELLGRDRLQRHLVRTAERQIVDHANAVLDRLSGGTLMLRLVAGEESDDRVLDLECWNRQTGGSPIPVAFLSGGQRFRVAVSLALGIGQYASRQHRPVESVIIDEGFGSLDRNGRQSVIQELHNLKGLMKCVILVSHQEEFADAFPQGYRFAIRDGATVVSPLHVTGETTDSSVS
jgi:exonuclease SbcC